MIDLDKTWGGVALENMPRNAEQELLAWLEETFGPSTKETWFIDIDYDLITLCFNEQIKIMHRLRWA